MKRALVVGVDQYDLPGSDLTSAVTDATAIAELLSRHADGDVNYECRVLAGTMEDGSRISRAALRAAYRDLFKNFTGDAVFYFSGHGILQDNGGYVCTTDASPDDWGIPMQELIDVATQSSSSDVLLLLDCCHGGDLANPALLSGRFSGQPLAIIRENLSVLAASTAPEVAIEAGGHGLFTAAVIDALEGGAADHMGFVTAPAVYAYVERRFGAWDQRPVYKAHLTHVPVIRECAPLIDRMKLRQLVYLFPTTDYRYQLDAEHEPEDEFGNVHEPVNAEKVQHATLLKEYRDAGLVTATVPGEQFFWVARRGHTVELTTRGREYWTLVTRGRI